MLLSFFSIQFDNIIQGHVDFVEVLIAAGFRRRRRGRRGSHQPGAEPVHDWSCGVGAVSREGQSRRPAASHSRTQTSCSAERARALAASSPAHPRQREGRGPTETNRGPERPTRNWPLAALAGRGLRSIAAASGAVQSLCPSAWTFRTSGSGWTRAPPEPSLKHQPRLACSLGPSCCEKTRHAPLHFSLGRLDRPPGVP